MRHKKDLTSKEKYIVNLLRDGSKTLEIVKKSEKKKRPKTREYAKKKSKTMAFLWF